MSRAGADRDPVEQAKVDAYRRQGIDIRGSSPSARMWQASPGWDLDWLMPRLIAADHVRYMVNIGRVVGVMTQPYGICDLQDSAQKLADLAAAGYAVDVCPLCTPHFPGYTLAVIHYRPDGDPPRLHLPHD